MNIETVLRTVIHTKLRRLKEKEVSDTLSGMPGRGENGYNSKFIKWLEMVAKRNGIICSIQEHDDVSDRGVDISLKLIDTKELLCFQIKSKNDVANKYFAKTTKAQIHSAMHYWKPEFLFIVAAFPFNNDRWKGKYFALLNHISTGYYRDSIEVISPALAASIVDSLDNNRDVKAQVNQVDWFAFSRTLDLFHFENHYLREWPGLLPNERFVEPKEYSAITASLNNNPITIVTGPRACGKTFCALQILWDSYKAQKHIKWFDSGYHKVTYGLFNDPETPPGYAKHIENISFRASMNQTKPPLDVYEFISVIIQPNSVIYFDDPFGKSVSDNKDCLFAQSYISLSEIIKAINKSESRNTCRILISTPDDVLDESELLEEISKCDEIEVHRLSHDSYKSDKLKTLASVLLCSTGLTNYDDSVITEILRKSQVPFDIESFVKVVDDHSTTDEILHRLDQFHNSRVIDIVSDLLPSSEAEELFLILLSAIGRSTDEGNNEFNEVWKELFSVLNIGDQPDDLLKDIVFKYRPYLSVRYGVFKDSDIIYATHSIVSEAISRYIRRSRPVIAKDLILRLPDTTIFSSQQLKIVIGILELGLCEYMDSVQKAVNSILAFEHSISFLNIGRILSVWDSLDSHLRRDIINSIVVSDEMIVSLIAEAMCNSKLSDEEKWKIVYALSKQTRLGASRVHLGGHHPWEFYLLNKDSAPDYIKKRIKELKNNQPGLLLLAWSELITLHWDLFGDDMKSMLYTERIRANKTIQKTILNASISNRKYLNENIINYINEQKGNVDPEIRAYAYMYLFWNHPEGDDYHELIRRVALDSDLTVPITILREGFGFEDKDLDYINALFSRLDKENEYARVLYRMHTHDKLERPAWFNEKARICVEKGGEYSKAILVLIKLSQPYIPLDSFNLPKNPKKESYLVQFSWLWAYTNQQPNKQLLETVDVISMIEGLPNTQRNDILSYMYIQSDHIPDSIKEYVMREAKTRLDSEELIRNEQTKRKYRKHSRILSFPAIWTYVDHPLF